MKEVFLPKTFHGLSYALINAANSIIAEYQAEGYTLTLRQLYYQFVARNLFHRKYRWTGSRYVRDQENGTINAQPNYDNLGALISDARLAGLVDWDAIEDRTRFLRGHRTYDSPVEAIAEAHKRYRIDMWENQSVRVEVWIEKDALVGVIERVCGKWDANFFACRGYASQSELYQAGKRIQYRRKHHGQNTIVLHLGDHDPSGCDMTRDNEERLSMFAGGYVEVRRLALNMDQIEEHDPPPNPAKLTDSRANAYIEQYGDESWELDALEPRVISRLIENEIKSIMDAAKWDEKQKQFAEEMQTLSNTVEFAEAPELWQRIEEAE